jgi:hypothetical protein
MVSGSVKLVFFDTMPRPLDVTGKSYDEILRITGAVRDHGGTSIGCGLDWAMKADFDASGIAIVSDGAENSPPFFAETLAKYQEKLGIDVPVYLYWMPCKDPSMPHNDPRRLANTMEAAGLALDAFDLRGGVDYYSLPNLAATMRANRYSLVEEIMSTPLLKFDEARDDRANADRAA